jgi:hypothetical protein
MSPQKKRQRAAVRRGVRCWCDKHADFMAGVERSMLYALQDGEEFTEADVAALLREHSLQPPFTVKEVMRHW